MPAIGFQGEGAGRSLDASEDSSQRLHDPVWGRRRSAFLRSSDLTHRLARALLSTPPPSSGGPDMPGASLFFHRIPESRAAIYAHHDAHKYCEPSHRYAHHLSYIDADLQRRENASRKTADSSKRPMASFILDAFIAAKFDTLNAHEFACASFMAHRTLLERHSSLRHLTNLHNCWSFLLFLSNGCHFCDPHLSVVGAHGP